MIVDDLWKDLMANAEGDSLAAYAACFVFGRGFHVLCLYRVQRLVRKTPIIGTFAARALWYLGCFLTNCDISYRARIAGGVRFPHAVAIVIGEATIGTGTTILQGVTVGKRKSGESTAVYIGENVYVGAGAKIIGPIRVESGASVGANAVVVKDVPAGITVIGVPAKALVASEGRINV